MKSVRKCEFTILASVRGTHVVLDSFDECILRLDLPWQGHLGDHLKNSRAWGIFFRMRRENSRMAGGGGEAMRVRWEDEAVSEGCTSWAP